MNSEARRVVRRARGGGMWFPGERKAIERMVGEFLDRARTPRVEGRIVSAISPHAGYVYSGQVAGYVFRALRDNAATAGAPETVVVLGFTHRTAFQGAAFMDGDAIETPLGETALDREAAERLIGKRSRLIRDYSPHAGEHSAENQVPFVQAALPQARLVIALIGDHQRATLEELLAGLNDLAKAKRIVVVASSDMLHDPDYDRVTATDRETLRKVVAMDYGGILREWGLEQQTFCGIGPVVTAMRLAEGMGCRQGTLLHYRNSGDDYPESRGQWVVGYGAVVFAV
jgi:AmmeMemoRadiSam system protein B